MNAAVIARQQDTGGAGHESQRVLIHVHHTPTAIAARGVVPHGVPVLPKPNVEGVEKGAVRIVRIHGDALVVPILGIVARAAATVSERSAGRAGYLSPGYAAIGRAIGAELAAIRTSAAAI